MRDKYAEIAERLKGTDMGLFSLAFLAFILAITVASLRLKLIIEAQELAVTFYEALSLTFIGYFFNNFLPTTIGGDVVKAYYLSRKTNDSMGSFTAVFVDRVIGLFTMVFMAVIALLFAGNRVVDSNVRYTIYAITLLAALALIFMVNKKFAKIFSALLFLVRPIEEKLRKAYNSIHKYQHHKVLMVQSFFISIISQLLFFSCLGILAFSIGSRVTAMEILLRMPIISMFSLLPSINGLGLREGSTVVFFGPLIGKGNAFAVSLLWLLVLLITSIIGGIVYGLSPQLKIKYEEIKRES